MSRPSLSASTRNERDRHGTGVAGADVPAFVERWIPTARIARQSSRVAGADVPAFVERYTLRLTA